MNRARTYQILFVLLFFSVVGVARHLHMYGEDLASSFVGCRLLAMGEGSHLYSHDPRIFSVVGDSAWYDMARQVGFTPLRLLHPYVQTPLWAWSLEPACTRMSFRVFCDLFIVLIMGCACGTLGLVARYWTPALYHAGWIALVFACLYVSEPFKYAIFLAQTHILFILLTIAALVLAERRRPVWAGVSLALAAAVKITPGFLLLYWLVSRRRTAALSFVVSFCTLTGLSVLAVGPELTKAYLHSLAENGNTLLVAFNNQSFAGWWMGLRFPHSELEKWWIYRLPAGVKVISLALSVATAVAGGLLDRNGSRRMEANTGVSKPPYGAMIALLGATMFAPIAWSHYYILLVVPLMMLLQAYLRDRRPIWLGFAGVIFLLNLYPISFGTVDLIYKSFSIARSQFFSGVIAIGALALLHRAERGCAMTAGLRLRATE